MFENFSFAQRTDWPLTSNKLSATLESLREKKVPILDLTESNPTRCAFSYLSKNIIQSLADEKNLRYAPASRGSLTAREAVCSYYREKGFTVSPEQIFLTANTSEAYSYLFRLLVDSEQQVLFPHPSYPLFAFLGDLNDVRIGTYPLVYEKKWHIDLAGARDAFCEDTKALVLVNPNNPTGSFVCHKEVEELNDLCRKHNAALICDEVFSDFAFNQEEDHVSFVDNDQVLTFVLGGISKTLGLPQMKLSWIVINGPSDLVEAAGARLEVIADTYLSVSTPAQNALVTWLSRRKVIQKEIHARIQKNFTFLKEQAEVVPGCELLAADGGWYAILKIPDAHDEEEWTLALLRKDHVFVHPGYFFDFEEEFHIVISLLPPDHIFQEGIQRIAKRIKDSQP